MVCTESRGGSALVWLLSTGPPQAPMQCRGTTESDWQFVISLAIIWYHPGGRGSRNDALQVSNLADVAHSCTALRPDISQ